MRRASLSIGTNAIVVLIIAVIMLGLIIGLVTRGFSAVEDRFLGQIEETEPAPAAPGSSQPITLSESVKFASAGDLVGMKVRVYNKQQSADLPGHPQIQCMPNGGSAAPIPVTAFDSTIPAQETGQFTLVFTAPDAAGTYLCQVQHVVTPSAEFRLEVE